LNVNGERANARMNERVPLTRPIVASRNGSCQRMSRPKLARLRAIAIGLPPAVAYPVTGPWTVVW
jgi:hypothetical protein